MKNIECVYIDACKFKMFNYIFIWKLTIRYCKIMTAKICFKTTQKSKILKKNNNNHIMCRCLTTPSIIIKILLPT